MAKENKVEYERVDEEGDKYKRILVKFNPKFLRGSDFEIEFIPFKMSVVIGKIFVSEIDSMSSIDLYRWWNRRIWLEQGGEKGKRWTILSKSENMEFAEYFMDQWRAGKMQLEPRQIISKVKRAFEGVANEHGEAMAYVYNHYLESGELGSLPIENKDFNIEKLRKVIEEVRYSCFTAKGEKAKRSFVKHLFDTHKTEYLRENIWRFINGNVVAAKMEYEEKHQK